MINFGFEMIKARLWLYPAIAALVLAGCSTRLPEKPEEKIKESLSFEESTFSALPTSSSKDWETGLKAFTISCRSLKKSEIWFEVCLKASETGPKEAQDFFAENFTPWQLVKRSVSTESSEILSSQSQGLMTGYYEPILRVSKQRTAKNIVPILGTPDDLLIVDLSSLYPQLKGVRVRGKLEGRKVVPYDSRAEIVKRKDLDRYALAWSGEPVEVFFLQIQGSGRLKTEDGKEFRVGYDDQNGHPYKAIGTWLIRKGYLSSHEMSMQRIQEWAGEHPDKVEEMLSQNPSFVFFKRRDDLKTEDGPIGAQGLPLTPEGSVAIDRRLLPLGVPLFISARQAAPALTLNKLVVAQDTGGAIRGPLRFDFFWGSGDEAGAKAGKQKSQVQAWLLLPRGIKPASIL